MITTCTNCRQVTRHRYTYKKDTLAKNVFYKIIQCSCCKEYLKACGWFKINKE